MRKGQENINGSQDMSEAATESSGDPRAIDPPFVAFARGGCMHFDVFPNITYQFHPGADGTSMFWNRIDE